MHEILIIDDEVDICDLTSDILEDAGYKSRTATDSHTALKAIDARLPSLMLLDVWLQGSELDGLGIIEIVKQRYPDLPIIVMSGHGNIETAVTALKLGAYDYLEKPFKEDKLLLMVRNALNKAKLKKENAQLRFRNVLDEVLIGDSPVISRLRNSIPKIANTNSRILIIGAKGTGKEAIARMIHEKSTRHDAPFVVVTPSNIVIDLELALLGFENSENLNSERNIGLLEQANGGTLFLDEVSDLPMGIQLKVLKILRDNAIKRIGSGREVEIDVRIIAGSSKNIPELITRGIFHEDLYHRLNVIALNVPSLTERREDIPSLCEHFLNRSSQISGLPLKSLGMDAIVALQSYEWPGNIHQLRNTMDWLTIMDPENTKEKKISASMLPPEILGVKNGTTQFLPEEILSRPLREAREFFEREYILAQLRRFGGNISKTAMFVEMERSALHRKIRLLELSEDISSLS